MFFASGYKYFQLVVAHLFGQVGYCHTSGSGYNLASTVLLASLLETNSQSLHFWSLPISSMWECMYLGYVWMLTSASSSMCLPSSAHECSAFGPTNYKGHQLPLILTSLVLNKRIQHGNRNHIKHVRLLIFRFLPALHWFDNAHYSISLPTHRIWELSFHPSIRD